MPALPATRFWVPTRQPPTPITPSWPTPVSLPAGPGVPPGSFIWWWRGAPGRTGPGAITGTEGTPRRVENRCARGIWAVVAAAALGIASGRAQTASSVLTGPLRVQKGSPVPGALVQARSQATGALRSTVTDREGRYRIDLLAPGTWTVVARLEDGTMSETRTVTLRLQETVTLDFTVGSALMERVTVVSSEPLVDPARTGGEFRIGGSEVDALPLAGRVVTDLALLDS